MNLDRYFIVGGLLFGVVFLSLFTAPFIAAVLIPAVVAGVFLLGNPRFFLFIYLVIMSIYPLMRVAAPIAPVRYLNELMGIILYMLFFGHLAMRKLDLTPLKKLSPLFVAMGIWFLFTWLLNRSPIKTGLQTAFTYFSFIPFVLLSINFFKPRDFKPFVFGTIWFFWINFALNTAWQLGINPLPNYAITIWQETGGHSSGWIDYATGTFGSQTTMSYFCVLLLFLLFALKLKKPDLFNKRDQKIFTIAIVGLFVQLYLTFTNHAYIYFAVAFIPFAAISGLWKKWQAVLGVVAGIMVIIIAFSLSEQLQTHFSKEQLRYRKEKLAYSAKVQLFNDLLVKNATDYQTEWLFGVGPGNGMGSFGKENLSPFALRMLLPYYQRTGNAMRDMQMTSVTGSTASAIFTLWGDFGLIGFLLFLGIYFRLFFILLQQIRCKNTNLNALSLGILGGLFMFFLINITLDVISITGIVCWIWCLVAFLLILKDKERNIINAK